MTTREPVAWEQALRDDAGLSVAPDGSVHLGQVRLEEIVARYGTPTFVYDLDRIADRYRYLTGAFEAAGRALRVRYAVKANANLAVLRTMADLGAGADIVSGGELARAIAAGIPPALIVFSGVGKTESELAAAMEKGIGAIHVESLEEIEAVARVAREGGYACDVGIRVNPGVTTDTHPYIATGQVGIKFGVPSDKVVEAAERIKGAPGLRLTTLAMHLGSQLFDPNPFLDAVRRLLVLRQRLVDANAAPNLGVLDIGGGLGVRYHKEQPIAPNQFADAIAALLDSCDLELQMEPGRFLIAPAGVLLTRILYRKHSGGKEFVVVDAGMNDLMRPSLYRAYHHVVPVRPRDGEGEVVEVVGPVCETGDWLASERLLPPVARGDVLAVLGAGAYAFSMGSNYNARCRPAEVVVSRGRLGLARARETYEDLYRGESPDPWQEPTEPM